MVITLWKRLALAMAVLAPVAGLAGPGSAAAQEPGAVDLWTEIGPPDQPVVGAPAHLSFDVTNLGDADATNVELDAQLPTGLTVLEPLQAGCTATTASPGTTVTCVVDVLEGGVGTGFGVRVEFSAVGVYTVSLDATADQPDHDGDAASTQALTVVDEVADLYGDHSDTVALPSEIVSVRHAFSNAGPTSAGGAQISGTFPAGIAVVPGSFSFGFNQDLNDLCSITATTFTCGPVGGEPGLLPDAVVSYQVVAPATPGVFEATSTIVGRNDPDHGNDTATDRVDVRAPAAEVFVNSGIGVHTWHGQETLPVVVEVMNVGELAADDVTLTLDLPTGWVTGLPTDPAPAGASCTTAPDGSSVTCAIDTLPVGAVLSFFAPVTSPATVTASVVAIVTATTSSPEHGDQPNSATDPLGHIGTYLPTVTVSPSSGLADGDEVLVEVTGFVPSGQFGSALCAAETPLTLADCDLQTLLFATTDAAGAASFTRPVSRFLVTGHDVVDCATEDCVVAVATLDLTSVGTSPIEFDAGPPPSGVTMTLDGSPFLSRDPVGPITVPATLACAVPTSVSIEFVVFQPADSGGAANQARSTVEVACTPGSPQAITSDLIGSFASGPADVLVRATAGFDRTGLVGPVEVQSHASTVAALQLRLADPNDTTVVTELLSSLAWRLQHNPVFAHTFWVALLAPS